MIVKYKNLIEVDLVKIKKDYPEFNFIFIFLDELTRMMLENSVEKKTKDTLIFVDYVTKKWYHIYIDKANQILNHCFLEYYFKFMFSHNLFYFELKEEFLRRNLGDFDKFFKFFLFELKKRNIRFSYKNLFEKLAETGFNKKIFSQYEVLIRQFEYKYNFTELQPEFYHVSSEPFEFSNNFDDVAYTRLFVYLDLLDLLKLDLKYLQKLDSFKRIDKVVNIIILLCFINVHYKKKN